MHRVTIDRSATVATIVAGGELDAYGAPDLRKAFAELTEASCVVVDLSAVSFLDSTALGVVVRAVREIAKRGHEARVVLPRGTARRIFELTTLDRVLPVAESRAQAVAALTGTAEGT
jgi:anti-sigma B factor antagonist